ncbi:MAG TPA: DUF971 domain-containing protein [Rhizomicrobium sp.]|jgi:DUF971 family protein
MSAWPTELRLDPSKTVLTVTFDSGETFALPSEYLRVESPSAEVQGHVASQKQILGGKRSVTIRGVEPVGNYAIRILFGDGHDTGLYSWDYLHELGCTYDAKWSAYLRALAARKLER